VLRKVQRQSPRIFGIITSKGPTLLKPGLKRGAPLGYRPRNGGEGGTVTEEKTHSAKNKKKFVDTVGERMWGRGGNSQRTGNRRGSTGNTGGRGKDEEPGIPPITAQDWQSGSKIGRRGKPRGLKKKRGEEKIWDRKKNALPPPR